MPPQHPSHSNSGRRAAAFLLAVGVLAAMGAVLARPGPPPILCECEARSWVVALGRRHLYLDIRCPEPYGRLSGRVEFTESRLRSDYAVPPSPERRNRLAKMSRGSVLRPPPFVTDMRDRAEGQSFLITPEQAECLQRDRVFRAQYILLGPNSNSALRAVAEGCGCPLPVRPLQSGGMMGEFPGIEMSPGPELAALEWAMFGLPDGPQPVPEAGAAAVSIPDRLGAGQERGPAGRGGGWRTLSAP